VAGRFDDVESAIAGLREVAEGPESTPLARASFHLVAARFEAARGAPAAAVHERAEMARAAALNAHTPLWERAALEVRGQRGR
jgi:hypothetical protein